MPAPDYDRGVLIRIHPMGAKVFMYFDEPGVFLNAFGTPVSPEMAREAGFDVDRLLKEREKRQRIAAAQHAIESEFGQAQVQEVVTERAGFKVIHIGHERHNVVDPDGTVLNTKRPLTISEALHLLDMMAPAPVQPAEEPAAR